MRKNVGAYIMFGLACIIAFPIMYIAIPRRVAALVGGLAKRSDVSNERLSNLWSNVKAQNIAGIITTIILLWVVVTMFHVGQETISLKILPRHFHHTRQKMFEGLIYRYREDYDDVPSAEAIARVMSVSRLYVYQSEYVVSKVIPYSIAILSIIAYTFSRNKTLGTTLLVGTAAIMVNVAVWGLKIADISAKREGSYMSMVEKMNNNFNNLINVYINNKEVDTVRKNESLNEENTILMEQECSLARNSNIVTTFLSVLVLGIVLVVGYKKVQSKQMSPVHLGVIVTIYVMYMRWSLNLFKEIPYVFRRYGIWKNNYPFTYNLFVQNDEERSSFKITKGSVRLVNVSFQFPGTKEKVLNGFDLHVRAGEKVAIIGRSGSGKTTIMKLILGLYRPSEGKVMIDDHDALDIKINEIRKKINYVNQRTVLFNDTILKNMQYGNSATDEEITFMLSKYELVSVFSDISGGLSAEAGINGGNLSLGMQKTVIVVRGILKRDSLIYAFDEPVAGLDPSTRRKVMHMILSECKGKTMLFVTHLKEIRTFADREVRIEPV